MRRAKLLALPAALAAAIALPGAATGAGETTPFALSIDARGDTGYPHEITVRVSSSGDQYVILSNAPVPPPAGTSCRQGASENELRCPLTDVTGFEIRPRGGDDVVTVAPAVRVPTLIAGGGGADSATGGGGPDKLVGGDGPDLLAGRSGGDFIYGNRGRDDLRGGPHADVLRGGPARDRLRGGGGRDDIRQ